MTPGAGERQAAREAPREARRELVAVVALVGLGAVLVLLASGRPWAHATVAEPPLPTRALDLTGRDLAGLVPALGLVALAAAVAVLATRRWWRVLVGVVVALAGAAVIGTTATLSASEVRTGAALREHAPAAAHRDAVVAVQLQGWRHVAAAGGILLVAAGLITAARGRGLATMGRRFDPPTRSGLASPPAAETDMWERIERGEDPTA